MQKTISIVILGLAAVAQTTFADPYKWNVDSHKDMSVTALTMTAPENHWKERAVAHVQLEGEVHKNITAGNVQIILWETNATQHVFENTFAYFHCDNHGCDKSHPMALALLNPNTVPTKYKLDFEFQMPYKTTSGQYHLNIGGQDQDHSPNFGATIHYQY